ncbi:MAG: glycosyltransferase [Clostridia bacterium]|nr:glycosyltransferase [Clostridia bacterium]
MAQLSLCMIVRDEEEKLAQCLESVRNAVDEIVIVDTGSADRTKEIAAGFTDRIYDYVWRDDFAAARNASFAYARMPYILWLDADDMLEEEECEKLIGLKASLDGSVDAVMTPYRYAFAPDGRCTLVFDRERIVRREAGFVFSGRVHEAMQVSGRVIHADISVRHTGSHGKESCARNLAIYKTWINSGEALAPRDWYYYARELMNAGEFAAAQRMFADVVDGEGWIENRWDACIRRGECLRRLGRLQEAKQSCLTALALAPPRAEALCAMGSCLLEEDDPASAIFWYRAALMCAMPGKGGAFVSPDAYGYIPLMQLCVCYDRLGEHEQAARMNEQALLLHPGDQAALHNRIYFERILKKTDDGKESSGREA